MFLPSFANRILLNDGMVTVITIYIIQLMEAESVFGLPKDLL